jgi:uncharacterized protein CbrC (UPF0167 family)
MKLPAFRYHPDPLGTGSVVASAATCRCCHRNRGYVYSASVYAEEELEDALCPWCIADGSAHARFDATFVDSEAFPDGTPKTIVDEISLRTPGYSAWQSEYWPVCCNDGTAFLGPLGIDELRAKFRDQEGALLSHIIYERKISGGAATRLLASLRRDASPTAYFFRCLHCERTHFHIDQS